MGRTRAAGVVPLLLTAGIALNACTDAPAPSPTSSVLSTARVTVADPNTVLNQLATDLRSRIDTLTKDLKTTYRGVTGNDSIECGTPTGDRWPQQWHYSQRLFLTEPDSRGVARQLAAKLRSEGWTERTDLDNGKELMLTLQVGGASIGLSAGSTGGGLAVTGGTACVNADGTVDHRPVG
jgi:hypothetical protein